MSFTLDDCIVSFRLLRDSQKFSASVQSCYFVILTEFQAAGFPEELWLSTRSLMDMAGLKSVSATQEARNVLKNHNLIDFKTTRKGTVYRLGEPILQYTPRYSSGTVTVQSRYTQRNTNGCVCYAQNADAITNTRDDGVENAAPLSPSPAPLSSIPQTTEAINPIQAPAGSASKADDEIAIEDIWEQMVGRRLERAQECNELRALEKAHGREIIKVAIAEHVRCNGRTFNYFKACLQTALKKKGGDKNVRVAQRPVNNRPNVLAFTAGRTAGDFGDTQTSGKGRFDDDEEPDYSWLYDGSASVAAGDRGD